MIKKIDDKVSKTYTKKTGRTFWDLLPENPKILFISFGIIIIIIIVLISNGYSIRISQFSIEKSQPIVESPAKDSSTVHKDSLASNSKSLHEKKPEESGKQINVEDSPGSIITQDQTGDNIIINPEKPPIVYLAKRTKVTITDDVYEKKFYFGNPEGRALRNVYLKVIFDNKYITVKADKWVWTGVISKGGEKIQRDSINNSIEYYTPAMGANILIEVVVKSKLDIQIKNFQYKTE